MNIRYRSTFLSPLVITLCAASSGYAQVGQAGMLRYPDVSQAQIVFVYANDLWLVDRAGGLATPLGSLELPTLPGHQVRQSGQGVEAAHRRGRCPSEFSRDVGPELDRRLIWGRRPTSGPSPWRCSAQRS